MESGVLDKGDIQKVQSRGVLQDRFGKHWLKEMIHVAIIIIFEHREMMLRDFTIESRQHIISVWML